MGGSKLILKTLGIGLLCLVVYAVFKNWIQPNVSAVALQASTPDCLYAVPVGDSSVHRVRFSLDGKYLAVAGANRDVVLDAETGKLVSHFSKGGEQASSFVFSRNSQQLVYRNKKKVAKIKSLDGKEIASIDLSKERGMLGALAFSPQLGRLFMGCRNGVCVYKTSGEKVTHFKTEESINSIELSSDSSTLYGGQWTGKLFSWNSETFADRMEVQAHSAYLSRIYLSPDGNYIVSLGREQSDPQSDQALKIWAAKDLSLIHSFPIGKQVTDFCLDLDAKFLIVSKSTGDVFAFEIETGDPVKTWHMGRAIRTVGISPDASKICVGLGKAVTLIDRNTHVHPVTGARSTTDQNGRRRPYYSIKGQSVSPGVALVLESKLLEQED